MSASQGTVINATSTILVRPPTEYSLVAKTQPFSDLAFFTTRPFCTDGILDMWVQGTMLQKSSVRLESSLERIRSTSVPLAVASPEDAKNSNVLGGVYRLQGPDSMDWYRVSINTRMIGIGGSGVAVPRTWDTIVFSDVSGQGFTAYISEARILPNQQNITDSLSACVGTMCNEMLSTGFSESVLAPLIGFDPVVEQGATAASVDMNVRMIGSIIPGRTHQDIANMCGQMLGLGTQNSSASDVFARSFAVQEGRSMLPPGAVGHCVISPDDVVAASIDPNATVQWPLITLVAGSFSDLGAVRAIATPQVEYLERDYTAKANRDMFMFDTSVDLEATEGSIRDDRSPVGESPIANASSASLPEGLLASAQDYTSCPGLPWGLSRINQRSLPLNDIYDPGLNGKNVHIYMLDTGVNQHSDFVGRMQPGVDCLSITCSVGSATDGNGHGTHTAGTALGHCYGVAKQSLLHPVKVLDSNGSGAYSAIIAGIRWAIQDVQKNKWRGVINLSLGGPKSSTLNTAVQQAYNAGLVVAVAAGNDYAADACSYSPSSSQYAITTAATTISDVAASYSNVGNCVDIWAPGTRVASADYQNYYGYKFMSGTSMASPHVAGTSALYLQMYPTATPAQVAQGLSKAAVDITLYPGTTTKFLQAKKSFF